MRILALTHVAPPDPARDVHGVYRRLRLFLRALAGIGDVEIVHFVDDGARSAEAERGATFNAADAWGIPARVRLAPINRRPRGLAGALSTPFRLADRGDFRPYSGGAQVAAVRRFVADGPALVFAHRLSMAELVRLVGGVAAPLILDIDDIEHDVRLRAARNAVGLRRRVSSLAELPALYLAERRAVRSAAMSFVCSQTDRDKLAARGFDTARIRIAPNALDLPTVCAPLAAEPVLLFLGAFGHEPNRRAAERLIGRIWPLVRARSRNARLLIAGRNPERIAQFPSPPPGVTFTGFAPDLDALYARTRAVCCPMDEGGGTRIKLIEAAGRGKPIVSTAVGAEGLAFVAGREILMGETDGELAAGALQLLGDDALAGAMAAAAFARASLLYSAEAVERGICAEITSVLRRAPDGASSRPALAELPASIAVKAPPCN